MPCWQVYAKTAGRRKKPVFNDPGKPSIFGKLASEKRKKKHKAAGRQPNFTENRQGELMPSREKFTGYQRLFGDSIGDFSAKIQPGKSSIFPKNGFLRLSAISANFCENSKNVAVLRFLKIAVLRSQKNMGGLLWQ